MRGRAASQVRTMNPATPQLSHGMRQAQDPCEEAWGEGAGEAAAGGDGGAVVRRGQSCATCGSTAADVAVADVADMGGDDARLLDGRGREGGESDGLEPGASHHRDAADHAPDTHSRRQGGEKGRENWERGALSAESIQEGIREGGPVLSHETTTTASAGSTGAGEGVGSGERARGGDGLGAEENLATVEEPDDSSLASRDAPANAKVEGDGDGSACRSAEGGSDGAAL